MVLLRCVLTKSFTLPGTGEDGGIIGTGALGDMACHILHPVFKGLKLKYPVRVEGTSTLLLTDCAPNAQMVKLDIP